MAKSTKDRSMTILHIDGTDYEVDASSDEAKAIVASIEEINKRITQLSNELAITDTARLSYTQHLRSAVRNLQPLEEDEG